MSDQTTVKGAVFGEWQRDGAIASNSATAMTLPSVIINSSGNQETAPAEDKTGAAYEELLGILHADRKQHPKS